MLYFSLVSSFLHRHKSITSIYYTNGIDQIVALVHSCAQTSYIKNSIIHYMELAVYRRHTNVHRPEWHGGAKLILIVKLGGTICHVGSNAQNPTSGSSHGGLVRRSSYASTSHHDGYTRFFRQCCGWGSPNCRKQSAEALQKYITSWMQFWALIPSGHDTALRVCIGAMCHNLPR